MKNILLLTDFSAPSRNAILYALKLFEKEKCAFHLLYIQDSTNYTTDDVVSQASTSLYDALINKNRLKLIAYATQLESEFDTENFNFQVMVDFDSVVASIKQSVRNKNIDLIVMGSNGATGAKEVVFGSNTLNVIRRVHCTTLVIPEDFTYQQPREMLLALDPSDDLQGKPIADFFKFIMAHNLGVHVLRFDSNSKDHHFNETDKTTLDGYIKDTTYNYHVINDIPMEYAVGTYLQTNPIDILGLIMERKNFLERLFLGSATTEISKHTHFPMLIFHI